MQFEKLDIWKRSSRLACDIYILMKDCRDFGFKDQITRSALSIPSNITEGEERETSKESARFFYYSKGSAGELVTQLYIGARIGYIENNTSKRLISEAKEISSMIASMIKIRKGFVKEQDVEYNN